MTENRYLSTLGLTQKQITLYLDLAGHPDSTVVQVHKRVNEPRSSIYLELERMIGLGFVISKKVGKSTQYKITDPHVLKFRFEEEKNKLQYLVSNLSEFALTVKQLGQAQAPKQTINIYKGKQGVKQLLWNIVLSKADEVIGFSPGQLEDVSDRLYAERWRAEFMRQNMHNRIIFNQPKPLIWSDIPHFLENHVQAKSLDEKKIRFDRLTLIYDDVLTVCSLHTDKDQYGIEIRDALLVNSYKQIFEFLWEYVAEEMKVK